MCYNRIIEHTGEINGDYTKYLDTDDETRNNMALDILKKLNEEISNENYAKHPDVNYLNQFIGFVR